VDVIPAAAVQRAIAELEAEAARMYQELQVGLVLLAQAAAAAAGGAVDIYRLAEAVIDKLGVLLVVG
jgi:hypothetical protein